MFVHVPTSCLVPAKAEEDVGSPVTGVTDSYMTVSCHASAGN